LRIKNHQASSLQITKSTNNKSGRKVEAAALQITKSTNTAVIDTAVLDKLVITLRALTNLVPTATNTLKLARTQVSKAAENMDSVFTMFEARGPEIFNNIASYWRLIWSLYFFFLLPMSIMMCYYGFWASGYCGGPQPFDESETPPPTTMGERLRVCCSGCCTCMQRFHDKDLCFWSAVLLMQVVVLLIFIISILLCILAAVKAFITSGCAQVYLLGDIKVCAATLESVKGWLETFHVEAIGEAIEPVCTQQALLTCQLISSKMKTSAILTTVFSFLGTLFSLQMLIESAILHEMAKFRRIVAMRKKDEDAVAA